MLRGLTRFDPARRWSVRRALRSKLFAPLLRSETGEAVTAADAAAAAGSERATLQCLEYLHDAAEDEAPAA